MRICYDYQVFAAQRYGGISRYVVEIASRISRFRDTDVQVYAPLYRSRFLQEKRDRLRVVGRYLASDFPRATGLCLGVDRVLSRTLAGYYRPDLVHETYYSSTKTVRSPAKTVITVHDTIAELFPDSPSRGIGPLPLRKAAYQRSDHLICISESTRSDLIRFYDVDPRKISVVPLASSIVPSTGPPIQADEPFFLFVGGRWGYKNFIGLAKAYREAGLHRTHKLVCFGAGGFAKHELEGLERLELPLSRFEMVEGDDDLLSRYYASAIALVYPSLYEGFGIPVLEAMECSCPVLCGTSSSLPEVAGDAAMYFDAGDPSSIATAMLRVVESREVREDLRRKGKERVRHFSWEKCAKETYAAYERALSGT
jgi:glycosyltransferase involved in cell wall biosynthesis